MAIQATRNPFGIKYAIAYDRCSFKPFGLWRVIGEMNLDRSIDNVPNTGGHISGAWDSEFGQPENSIALTVRELPFFAFTVLEGATTNEIVPEATGSVGALTNKQGTSVFDATTGIDSIAAKVGVEQNIKAIRYIFVATGPATVDIHLHGDGTPFETIEGVVASNITVPSTGGTVDVDSLGITITGGSGTIAFVTDDTASSDTRPIHQGFGITPVGSEGDTPTSFGLLGVYPKKSDGMQFWIDFPNVVGSGLPIGATTREWSESSITLTPLIDTATDRLYTFFSKLPDVIC
ncbi:hypothetical protein LCGC14_0405080 [marine sediment metagenome]|uniref:Uncharacterized protein n=1 Tax=marine sediment metagenome TaxID=412755 RepID=A0A0F9T136_9ZZZZ